MKSFTSFLDFSIAVDAMPAPRGIDRWDGPGFCYLLIADSMFKVGATKHPYSRIPAQKNLRGEPVREIHLSAPLRSFRDVEKYLKRAAVRARRFKHLFGGPVETFYLCVLPLFREAIAAAEAKDRKAFCRLCGEVEAASQRAPKARLDREDAAFLRAGHHPTPSPA